MRIRMYYYVELYASNKNTYVINNSYLYRESMYKLVLVNTYILLWYKCDYVVTKMYFITIRTCNVKVLTT